MLEISKMKSKIKFGIIGALSAFFASIIIFVTFLEPTHFHFLKYNLVLEKEDLFSLVLLLSVISVSAFLYYLIRTFWITFFVLLCAVVTFGPYPIIRLSLYPSQETYLGHRLYVRGLNHGPNELRPRFNYQPILTYVYKDKKPVVATCHTSIGWELGPIGYFQFVDLIQDESGILRFKKETPIEKVSHICSLGLDLSFLSVDTQATQLLAPFIFKGVIQFDESELSISLGHDYSGSQMTALARYLYFLKSPENAKTVGIEQYDNETRVISVFNSRYTSEDYLYSFFMCDLSYFQFLQGIGLQVPVLYKNEFNSVVMNHAPFIDSSDWIQRRDPMEKVSNKSLGLSIAEDITSQKCQDLSRM